MIFPDTLYSASSIYGDVTFTGAELLAGTGTDWSDESPIPVWVVPPPGYEHLEDQVGTIDPYTGLLTTDDGRTYSVASV